MIQTIEMATLVAAMIDTAGGVLYMSSESMAKSYGGLALAINFDTAADRYSVTLIDEDEANYEDE